MKVRNIRTAEIILGYGMNTHVLPDDARLRAVVFAAGYPTVLLDYDADDEGKQERPNAEFQFAVLRPMADVPFGVSEYLGSFVRPETDGVGERTYLVYWGR